MIYFLEVGLVLIVVPWSAFWDRNAFIESYPQIRAFVLNNFVRGTVSGFGILNLWAGLSDLATLLGARRAPDLPPGELAGAAPMDGQGPAPDGRAAAKFSRPAPEA